MFAMGTAVVGSVALMAKLGVEELQHHTMKQKINNDNVYSSIRIFPDLVRFQGFIRIHRVQGDIVCAMPQSKQNNNNNNNDNDNNDNTPLSSSLAIETATDDDTNNHNDNTSDMDVDSDNANATKQETSSQSAWLSSISRFASSAKKSLYKLQTMYEVKHVEFLSAFPFVLRDCVLAKRELRDYLLTNQRYLELFEPLSTKNCNEDNEGDDQEPVAASLNESTAATGTACLNQRWEFCAIKVHHETLYIRYENKWLTLSLNSIDITPLSLAPSSHADANTDADGDMDVMQFIVDYQNYFIIDDKQGYVLLCQHLDDASVVTDATTTAAMPALTTLKPEADSVAIAIPDEHSQCPYPFIQRYLVGHCIGYHSRRKEKVLEYYAKDAALAMKQVAFDNVDCYTHAMQFRACVDATLAQMAQMAKNPAQPKILLASGVGEDNAVVIEAKSDNDITTDVTAVSKEEQKEAKEEEQKTSIAAMPYFELLHQRNHAFGLHTHELSDTEWRLSSEAAWLSNYVYDIQVPTPPQQTHKRRDSWSQFKAYWSEASSSNLMNDVGSHDNNNNNNNNDDDDDDNPDEDMQYNTFCGPSEFASNELWRAHSQRHCRQLHEHGFQLLDYAVTMPGTSVQWMLCRSYDHANTVVLSFKGTSNPLDAMVNIGLHPLYLPQFQCSVFSGMFAALQQSLSIICHRLKYYSSDDYFHQRRQHSSHDNVTKIHRLIICGHSLGGSYAQLFTAHLLSVPEFEDYFSDIQCITFGSPLVFCKDVKQSFLYDALARRVLNFVYQFDLVPRLQNKMQFEYRTRLLQGLLLSQLPVSNIGIIFDVNQRMNFVMQKFQRHQWLLDRYEAVGKFVSLFEKDAPTAIDSNKKCKCFTKGAHSYHLALDAESVLTLPSHIPNDRQIYASQILNDHKMLNYMKTVMFQTNIV